MMIWNFIIWYILITLVFAFLQVRRMTSREFLEYLDRKEETERTTQEDLKLNTATKDLILNSPVRFTVSLVIVSLIWPVFLFVYLKARIS